MLENASVGTAISGPQDGLNAALGSPRPARLEEDLQVAASFTKMERKVLDRMERGEGRWIELLATGTHEDCLYRACSQNGAICRYTNDLWQAEIYVQYP